MGVICTAKKHKIYAEINNLLKNKNKLHEDISENQITPDQLEIKKQKLENDIISAVIEKENILKETENLENELQSILCNIEKYKLINTRQQYSKSKGEKTPTSWESINDTSSTTRYSRQGETKKKEWSIFMEGLMEPSSVNGIS